MKLKDRNIILTGAIGGIGKQIAQKCDSEGANLFLIDLSKDQLVVLLQSLKNENKKSACFDLDISNEQGVITTISKIESICDGRIHVLINNAGVQSPIGEFETNSLNDWKENIKINLFGAVNLTHAVLSSMTNNKSGRIINLAGGGSTSPRVNFSAYGIAKTAIVRFTETIAKELEKHDVFVNAVSPGAINTRMLDEVLASGENAGNELSNAIERKGKGGDDPKHIAELIAFLASDNSFGITGKLISAIWDPWRSVEFQELLRKDPDIASLRRIDNKYFIKKP